ncbi:hypothetical protein POM88_003779 [Heracleum sosnowskyi]|uniref:Transposase MuDR plant domain-containing protein n=1 Tax=Heracleum sosnowskyi TaxID=360622 RepID=A0AAD8JIM1_9APIA|nr:hypothetical protein POM88_003779 [Heracleum sosnowskyi]
MKKATVSKVNKQSSSNVNEESQKKLYTVIVYYGGHFVHIPVFSYTTNTSKIYENVDLEELSVPELKVCVGDILGEFDSLYYILHTGIRLFTSTNKDELVELSKQCDYSATFYVYHQTPTDWDDDIDNFRDNGTYNCSASYDDFSSEEESDKEVCYATPPKFKKGKKVEEIFNAKTAARDIKWKVGLVFANKIEFKEAIRSSSMKTGRPYQYLVDDLKRIQVGCAKGCPFKMWTTYIEATQGWQVKTLCNEHNCVWSYKNKLVTVKWLAEKYGDKIRKNPNWKLGKIHEEFKKELKVDVEKKREAQKTMAPDVEQEVRVEEELQNKEAATSEAEMMDELLNQMEHEHEEEIPRLDDDVEIVEVMPPKVPKKVASKAMKFIPTPGIRNLRAHVTASTPLASTPLTATSQKQNKGKQPSTQQTTSHMPLTRSSGGTVSKNVKQFRAPRQTNK